jgi:hypothetical protein
MPKKYAKGELETYYQASFENMDRIKGDLDTAVGKLKRTKAAIQDKLVGHQADAQLTLSNRRKKENKHHSSHRKQIRLQARACTIAQRFGSKIVDGHFSPAVTGQFQMGKGDFDLSSLQTQKMDSHLSKTLLYMYKEGYFTQEGWETVQRWLASKGELTSSDSSTESD